MPKTALQQGGTKKTKKCPQCGATMVIRKLYGIAPQYVCPSCGYREKAGD